MKEKFGEKVDMTNTNNSNNIFVPQTFNGERMVNVTVPNRRNGGTPPTPTTTTTTNDNISTTPQQKRPATEANVIQSVKKAKASKSRELQQIHQNTQQAVPPTKEGYRVEKYWSEGHVVILIQLVKKHLVNKYHEDVHQNLDIWTNLTNEYNALTFEERTTEATMKQWEKVINKYNAERSTIKTKIPEGQPPMVSYWSHFQFLDGFLNHLPIPPDSLYRLIPEENKKQYNIIDEKLGLLEKHRLLLDQTSKKQQSQIDLMKKSYDSMNAINMKFVEMCDKATSKSQSNEDRYLKLLERFLDDKSKGSPPKLLNYNEDDQLDEYDEAKAHSDNELHF